MENETKRECLKQRKYLLRELVSSEKKYVEDLSLVVDGYLKYLRDPQSPIPVPTDLRGPKERLIFGNIQAIYEWHRDHFYQQIKPCIEHPDILGPLFQKSRLNFEMYIDYCKNKPFSDYLEISFFEFFNRIKIKLQHNLLLRDLLIKPVQRITKYGLLLRDILKYTEQAGLLDEIDSLRSAYEEIKAIPKAADDMMDVSRLQNFEGKITKQGRLLHQGSLTCLENNPGYKNSSGQLKFRELHVFLFEQNMIFADIIRKKSQFHDPTYIYRTHIQMNKLQLINQSRPGCKIFKFVVRSIDKDGKETSVLCTCNTHEDQTMWLDKISLVLKQQNALLDNLVTPTNFSRSST